MRHPSKLATAWYWVDYAPNDKFCELAGCTPRTKATMTQVDPSGLQPPMYFCTGCYETVSRLDKEYLGMESIVLKEDV